VALRVVALVPARGGSKGIPRKNIRLLAGKPLLQYTIEAARSARLVDRIVLTTDDTEIAEVGRRLGIDVPFLRPVELAGDATPTLPVVEHALRWLEAAGDRFDAVAILQPTSPLRSATLIDDCIELLERSKADTVMTVLPVPAEHNPHWVFFQDSAGLLRLSTGERAPIARRQELPPAFHREGSVYVTRRDVVLGEGAILGSRVMGFPVDPGRSVNLDETKDWERAERLLGVEANA
jgi:CMP-N,N'-diacetyllegionaminic acid synthase